MAKPFALVVEDEYDLSIIFAKALQAAGFETHIIRSGDKALNWLRSMTPELVLLDLNLPRVPGTEILKVIRSDDRLVEVCVIIATAYPHLADNVRSEADWILLKPVNFGQLRDLAKRIGTGELKATETEQRSTSD